ncbi:polyketide cyclase [Marinomonas balearica]|uniref:Polyketide cyclase/dehydrase/lipid transport protein n=1 Tax=Marinomonas balearica TaxID=491947 RepID=A0A4R6MDT1_9GAMM|nr:polyketide cyclase [Marinomonas balearica]TDO99898.1 hypothetical protein DFP79_0907 [Marinomonas balearica]
MLEVRPGSFYYQLRMVMRYLAIAILVAFLIGLFLPATYTINRSIVIDASRSDVMAALKSVESIRDWMYVKNGRIAPKGDMPLSGGELSPNQVLDISYDAEDRAGQLTMVSVSNSGIQFDVIPRKEASVVSNAIQISKTDSGILVTWTVNGELNAGLFSSYIAMFANNIAGQNFEISLKNLKSLVEQRS